MGGRDCDPVSSAPSGPSIVMILFNSDIFTPDQIHPSRQALVLDLQAKCLAAFGKAAGSPVCTHQSRSDSSPPSS